MRSGSLLAFGSIGLLLAGCPSTEVVVLGSSSTGGETGDTGGEIVPGDTVEDHRTYFISETTKFDGGGLCENADLIPVTKEFRNVLADAGWSGRRLVNENTWPEDMQERTFDDHALDGVFGDAARLSVFAGHGLVGELQWGTPSPEGDCRTTIPDQSRFGTLAGDTAAAVMLLASCTMRVDQLWETYERQMSRQIFGYHNSPFIDGDEARLIFVRSQDGQVAADAWLEEMVLNVLGKNSPLVFTKGITQEEAISVHGATNLATGEGFMTNVGEPAGSYRGELYDSGCSAGCGACDGNAPTVPELPLGAPTRRVKLTRPSRSALELVDHVTTGLALYDVEVLDEIAGDRLRSWAEKIAVSGELHYAILLGEPRIDVVYDPRADLLRITNRDALARARPNPRQDIDDPPGLQDTLLLEADAVRAELAVIPGALDRLGTDFEVTTRVVVDGQGDDPPTYTVIETMFTLPGRLDGLALPDRHLGIGITRLGELSTITVSNVDVEIIGESQLGRQPQDATDFLLASLAAQYPSAEVELVAPRLGYVLGEAESSVVAEPSLIVGYVLTFGTGGTAVVSRRYPVRVSLAAHDAPIESLAATDPNPDPGDDRASN